MLYVKLLVFLEFRCLLLLAVDTVVSIVIGIVDDSDIVIDVCFDVGSVVGKAVDIADDSNIAIESCWNVDSIGCMVIVIVDAARAIKVCSNVNSAIVMNVSSYVSIVIVITDGLDRSIEDGSDMAIIIDSWISWWFIACLRTVSFLPSRSTAM